MFLGVVSAGCFGAIPATVTLVGSPNPVTFGQPVTLTATVTPAVASGTVTFYDGATVLGTSSLANDRRR